MSFFICCFRSQPKSRRSDSQINPSSSHESSHSACETDIEAKLEAIKMKHRIATMNLPKWVRTTHSKVSNYEDLPLYKLVDGAYVCSGTQERVYFYE